ncbi:putative pectinesterase/pectinesterase inhibitor 34 [Nymphaea thermarum]|nr:putative pectinesterase/pectinesterase inhibitor 34 [Nymphaea thermarum]
MASPYRKMGKQELGSEASLETGQVDVAENSKRKKRLALLCIVAVAFLLASGVAVGLYVRSRRSGLGSRQGVIQPSQEIVLACRQTLYPNLCIDSLVAYPGAQSAGKSDLVRISVNMTLQHVGRAFTGLTELAGVSMTRIARQAVDDCLELLANSVDQLSRSIAAVADGRGGASDVMTWLSAALTNQDTCTEGMGEGAEVSVRDRVAAELHSLEEIVSNCLAIYAVASGDRDFAGVPIQNRRLLAADAESEISFLEKDGFPSWVTSRDRGLLAMESKDVQADMVVASDGSGTYKTIEEAIKAVPEKSTKRTVIYVKAGRNVLGGYTTFHSATFAVESNKLKSKKNNDQEVGFHHDLMILVDISCLGGFFFGSAVTHELNFVSAAATGTGFIARDITFENTAGPQNHQAVALRIGADHAVVYRCAIIGYQDTLYVHSQRQFYRECDIYGSVDFIFGNAAVVIQNCSIYARKPMDNQKNTITAQNRKDPNQNTGISIHMSQIRPADDLVPFKGKVPTYLGRPWKLYSRVVYMLSYMDDHINPEGWLPWSGTFALDTLFYGEYMNYGPGAAVGKRVQWPGYRVITSPEEAGKFTVAQFIYGSSWLPSTGVAFLAGLTQ